MPSAIYAVCPTCGERRDLARVPVEGAPWPRCDDCDEMMQVFVSRSSINRAKRKAAA